MGLMMILASGARTAGGKASTLRCRRGRRRGPPPRMAAPPPGLDLCSRLVHRHAHDLVRPGRELQPAPHVAGVERPAVSLDRRDDAPLEPMHVHLAEAARSKDGASAGVALAVALVSALTGRPARGDVAMTGELTIAGIVEPVAGIREKVLAALPGADGNRDPAGRQRGGHRRELPDGLPCGISVRCAGTMDDVLAAALPGAVGGQGPLEVEP